MSKGKDFRAPRKRGFDDDGPMPYEPRPADAARLWRRLRDGGFGGPPMGRAGLAPGAPARRSTRS